MTARRVIEGLPDGPRPVCRLCGIMLRPSVRRTWAGSGIPGELRSWRSTFVGWGAQGKGSFCSKRHGWHWAICELQLQRDTRKRTGQS